MQPIARPVARLVWGHARLGFDRAAWYGKTPGRGPALTQSLSICVRCTIQAIGGRGRLYSTQIPPGGSDGASKSSPGSQTDRKTESEPIDQFRAETVKAEGAKLHETGPDGAKSNDAKQDNPKAHNIGLDNKELNHELPSWAEGRRTQMTQKFSEIMDKFQTRALHATQTLNDITGYTGIEKIKSQNAVLEDALAEAHERVRTCRQAYKTSNSKRAGTQREVTTLLARKDTWSPMDLERFTELYRTDHVLESEVAASQEALTEAEAEEQSLNQRLNAGILKRYHEEQIWSDRIRRASTWGTWGLMGMNFVLFVILQFVAEPWKRRRLVKGVVAEEKKVLEEVRNQLQELRLAVEKRDMVATIEEPIADAVKAGEEAIAQAVEGPAQPQITPVPVHIDSVVEAPVEEHATLEALWQAKLKEVGVDLDKWRAIAEDLYSDRRIDLRMRDASLLALQGAIAGAALTGSIVLLIVRRS